MHRIMIVEDDADVRESLRQVLEEEGYSVAEASNGAEALDWLRTHDRPCLVLLDLMMPVLDGQGFLKRLAKDPLLGSVSVILVSAARRDLIEAAARCGPTKGILTKPLQLQDLLEVVEQFC